MTPSELIERARAWPCIGVNTSCATTSLLESLCDALESAAATERARIVKRLREEAEDCRRLNPGSVMADWTNRCADLLERESL